MKKQDKEIQTATQKTKTKQKTKKKHGRNKETLNNIRKALISEIREILESILFLKQKQNSINKLPGQVRQFYMINDTDKNQ